MRYAAHCRSVSEDRKVNWRQDLHRKHDVWGWKRSWQGRERKKDGITQSTSSPLTRKHDSVLDTLIVVDSFPLLGKVERVICVWQCRYLLSFFLFFSPCCFWGGYFFASLLLILGWFLCLSARLRHDQRDVPFPLDVLLSQCWSDSSILQALRK